MIHFTAGSKSTERTVHEVFKVQLEELPNIAGEQRPQYKGCL